MGRRIEIEPRWLVSLLVRWALKDIPGRELGYSSGCGWMRGFKSSPATAIESPTGLTGRDVDECEQAMKWLHENYQPLWAATMMYYKAWTIRDLQEMGFPFGPGNKTYYNRLHEAHAKLANKLNEMQAARTQEREELLLKLNIIDPAAEVH
jgi:hypothetical protein